jgi:hypothetical protein
MDLIDFLFAALVIAGSLLIWFYIKSRVTKQNRISQVWREFARLNDLEEKPGKGEALLTFHGKNQGLPFLLQCIETEGTPVRIGKLEFNRGEDSKIFTRMQVNFPGLPQGLRVYQETKWSKLGKAIGMQDITTGDPEFDRSFMVKGKEPHVVIDYLTASRRTAMLTHAAGMKGLELREEGLTFLQPGQIESVDELGRLFSGLGSLALALARPR